jgi:hypothetical protein
MCRRGTVVGLFNHRVANRAPVSGRLSEILCLLLQLLKKANCDGRVLIVSAHDAS